MNRYALIVMTLAIPSALAGQSPARPQSPDGVILEFVRFADIYGSRLVAAFDSIPASRYDYRPTPAQQTVGYIAQHLEGANYGLCERVGTARHAKTSKDSLADTIKARWPKDTLVARLRASLRFCDGALERLPHLQPPALASTLLGFETDLAEHYSQISNYMRLLGMVPPSALPPRHRAAIEVPTSALEGYVGHYRFDTGQALDVALRHGALFATMSTGGAAVRLWAETSNDFFVNEVDAQVTFQRDASGGVTGLVLHQYDRDRPAWRMR